VLSLVSPGAEPRSFAIRARDGIVYWRGTRLLLLTAAMRLWGVAYARGASTKRPKAGTTKRETIRLNMKIFLPH
jgi:hypothetical protein